MQQVQAGKLNLDVDVNTYLDFKIPEKFGKPITLRNLLSHTSGFSYPLWDPNVVRYLKAARSNPALPRRAGQII